MNKKILVGIIALVFITLSIYLPYKVVPGVYINTNFEESMVPPFRPDTLIVYKNGNIESTFFKDATYKLRPMIFSSLIIISHGYNSIFEAEILGVWLNKPKIMVFHDANHYYKKIASLPKE